MEHHKIHKCSNRHLIIVIATNCTVIYTFSYRGGEVYWRLQTIALRAAGDHKWALIAIALTWAYGLLVGVTTGAGDITMMPGVTCVAHLVLHPVFRRFLLAALVIPEILVAIIYTNINKVIRRQQNTIVPEGTQQSVTLKNNLHIAKTFLMVVGVFILCYAPLILLLEISIHVPPASVDGPQFIFIVVFAWVNSAANPIIYALRMTSFRDAMWRSMFGCQATE